MKTGHIAVIAAIATLGLLTYTNPQKDRYEQFLQQQIAREATQQGGLTGVLGSLLGQLAGSLIAGTTTRNDYVFFSTYETRVGNGRIRSVGALNNFLVLEMPATLKKAPE
ncbi:MAG: hypothetical protein H6R10_3157 [Rhodocyclaceae bacterium]|nr:hypothetical protein [Rhodocyclaceae bacterium]